MLRTSNHSAGNGMYEGFIVDIMNKVAEIVGFRYSLVPAWDGRFGYVGEDGQWDGMVGELVRRVSIGLRNTMFYNAWNLSDMLALF